MPDKNCRPRISRISMMLVFCFFVLSFVITSPASAHNTNSAEDGPSIQRVTTGFDEQYQDGNWVPVQVTLSNNGADFSGKVSIQVPSSSFNIPGNSTSTYVYQEPVSLPPGSHKQVTLYIPLSLGTQGNRSPVTIDLLDNNDHKVASRTSSPNSVSPNTIVVGILSTQPNNFGMLNSALSSVLNASIIQTKTLTATTLPNQAEILRNFDAIIIDNFATQTLATDQITAIQSWVNQGGILILAGGPEWQRTIGHLPSSLLPLVITGTDTLPAGTHLLPISGPVKNGQADTVQSPVTISVAKPQADSSILLKAGNIPLITSTVEGLGSVFYLAYDPALEPFVGWAGTSKLWSGLILRTLGDQILSNSTGSSVTWQGNTYGNTMDTLLKSFFPDAYPPNWLILVLLLSYILLLGPIRLIFVRRLKKRDWSWRIVLTTIVVFTLLSYGLALQQKGTSIVSSSISVIQLNHPDTTGSAEHVTTYVGVFVPSQGDFVVHIPGSNLVQSSNSQQQYQTYPYRSQSTTQQTIVQSVATGTDVDLKGVDIWTARTLVAKHDLHTAGGITSNLSLQQNTISGTVTNTLPYALNDIYVLVGNDYKSLGTLPPNSTQAVQMTLAANLNSNGGNGQQQSIADQIASKVGIVGSAYSAYSANTNQTQDEPHRHAAMLEALSGGYCDGSSPCYRSSAATIVGANGGMTKRLIYNTGARDPLLLAGAPATLIGWTQAQADPASNVTINGQALNGTRETFIQAPLNINYTGNIHIPASFVRSQISNMEQDQTGNIQEVSPGTYTMTVGSMTFEYTLPNTPPLQKSSLSFRASSNPARIPTQNTGTTTDINHVQTYLYNWQTRNWDSVTFSQFTLLMNNANSYIGPGNRVLLHIVNQDMTVGTTIFDRPTLDLQATVSS